MSYPDLLSENYRLVILRELNDASGYKANDSMLQIALDKWGQCISRDQVRTHLAWLAEQGLVSLEVLGAHTHVATLTERGADVATGRSTVPGVKRPSPRG